MTDRKALPLEAGLHARVKTRANELNTTITGFVEHALEATLEHGFSKPASVAADAPPKPPVRSPLGEPCNTCGRRSSRPNKEHNWHDEKCRLYKEDTCPPA